MGRLEGRAALVTGGSGGIGAATLRRFAAEGAAVVCADLDEEGGAALVEELVRDGARARFDRCDVGSPEQVSAVVEACVADYGRIDVLFNNAGIVGGGSVASVDLEYWDRCLRVMLSAALYGMQAAIPHMLEQGGGSIISTSSIYGLVSAPGVGAYASAKAGLINLTRTAALEYGRRGIRVNAICPGVVDTPMFAAGVRAGHTSREQTIARQPLGRLIEPEEVANLALFLASDESSAVSGQAIVIDGGLIAECNLGAS